MFTSSKIEESLLRDDSVYTVYSNKIDSFFQFRFNFFKKTDYDNLSDFQIDFIKSRYFIYSLFFYYKNLVGLDQNFNVRFFDDGTILISCFPDPNFEFNNVCFKNASFQYYENYLLDTAYTTELYKDFNLLSSVDKSNMSNYAYQFISLFGELAEIDFFSSFTFNDFYIFKGSVDIEKDLLMNKVSLMKSVFSYFDMFHFVGLSFRERYKTKVGQYNYDSGYYLNYINSYRYYSNDYKNFCFSNRFTLNTDTGNMESKLGEYNIYKKYEQDLIFSYSSTFANDEKKANENYYLKYSFSSFYPFSGQFRNITNNQALKYLIRETVDSFGGVNFITPFYQCSIIEDKECCLKKCFENKT